MARRPLLGALGALGAAAVLTGASAAVAAPPAVPGAPGSAAAPGGGAHEDALHEDALHEDALRALGARVGLRVGTAVNTDLLGSDAAYTRLVDQQSSTVTPENAMKWEVVEPQQGTYDWSGADELVASARAHGQLVRGHTLVWHSQLPAWLATDGGTTTTFTDDQLKAILKKHVQDEVSRFRGRIWQWDVVNEAFNDDGTPRQDIWYKAWGGSTDYIADAFRWAHEADPQAELFYNDYNTEYAGPKSDAVHALVARLKAQRVPISGVGFQTHLSTQYGFPALQQQLQRFSDLGLDVAETEVDVRTSVAAGTTNTPATPLAQSAQEAYWSQSLQACLAVQRCISYTVWGVGDASSWVPSTFPGEGAALLFDEHLAPKPQFAVLQQDLALAGGAPHRSGRGAGR